MPRRRRPEKRKVEPDPKFNSVLAAKFINSLMERGKKSLAQHIFYSALDEIGKKAGKDGYEVMEKAVANVKPVLEVASKRVGGATYQVPIEVRHERKRTLAIRWLIQYSKNRPERTMAKKLAGELLDAYNSKGGAIKKKEDTFKMAEANKAYAHYR
jgi:small subunit ribosomal protein S7